MMALGAATPHKRMQRARGRFVEAWPLQIYNRSAEGSGAGANFFGGGGMLEVKWGKKRARGKIQGGG
jgi:hypothetical protein